jgi:hypothetical protein
MKNYIEFYLSINIFNLQATKFDYGLIKTFIQAL